MIPNVIINLDAVYRHQKDLRNFCTRKLFNYQIQ